MPKDGNLGKTSEERYAESAFSNNQWAWDMPRVWSIPEFFVVITVGWLFLAAFYLFLPVKFAIAAFIIGTIAVGWMAKSYVNSTSRSPNWFYYALIVISLHTSFVIANDGASVGVPRLALTNLLIFLTARAAWRIRNARLARPLHM